MLPDSCRCSGCEALYPRIEGIPILVADNEDHTVEEEGPTQRQREYFDREDDAAFEITRPHGTPRLHEWLLADKFRRSVTELRPMLDGALVVSVCGGSGMDAEFLARAGARVVVVADISLGAAKRASERARRSGLPIVPVVADAIRLPLADRSVDIAYVHDGLHHLGQPFVALGEMARVARRAVSVTEPARAALTAAAVKVGLALDREEAGNEVVRLTTDEIEEEFKRHGFRVLAAERYGMYYRHKPGLAIWCLSVAGAFEAATFGLSILNRLGGRFGNKLAVQAERA
jgi:ubiquinone/menaquinone biosynthesis C-methylase UbiE